MIVQQNNFPHWYKQVFPANCIQSKRRIKFDNDSQTRHFMYLRPFNETSYVLDLAKKAVDIPFNQYLRAYSLQSRYEI